MPLDSRTVDAIHTRLLARYGTRWIALYAGVPPEAVKADWADVLDGLQLFGIRRALSLLPVDHVPNAAQFRTLALSGPPPTVDASAIAADRPPADRPRLVRELSRIAELQAKRGPKQWAYDLRAREQRGETLSQTQRFAWREALRAFDISGGESDAALTARLKDEAARRVAEYAERMGIDMTREPTFADQASDPRPDPGMVPEAEREGEAWA